MTDPDCLRARELLRALHEGRLEGQELDFATAHLRTCEACRKIDAEERIITGLLRDRLPRRPASDALKSRLLAEAGMETATNRRKRTRALPAIGFAFAAAVVAVVALSVGDLRSTRFQADPVVEEAVNDHLRVVYAEHPVEIESGGIHQVKPWFTGRVDFAPRVAFGGDADFPLVGGAVGYFIDRKAATFLFKRRLHTVTLFVMRAEGLSWPARSERRMGRLTAAVSERRGFHVVLFRDGDLAYALVSDVDPAELLTLGERIVGSG